METPPFQNSKSQPTQNSPAQLLNDAQRAESGGLIQFALQFYRQIIEQYPTAPEAAVAQDSLMRLMNMQSQGNNTQPPQNNTQPLQQGGQPPLQPNSAMQHGNPLPHQSPMQGPNSASSPMRLQTTSRSEPMQQESTAAGAYKAPQLQQQAGPVQPDTTNATRSNLNLEPGAGADAGKRPPPFKEPKLRRYPLGNIFAMLTIALGSCILGFGLASMALVFFAPNLVGVLSGLGSPILAGAIALIIVIVGIAIVLNGIVARAVFANARLLHGLALAALQRQGLPRR